MKRGFIALVAALASFAFVCSAHATNIGGRDLGELDDGASGRQIGAHLNLGWYNSGFSDTYSFTVSSNSKITATATGLSIWPLTDIDSLSTTLYGKVQDSTTGKWQWQEVATSVSSYAGPLLDQVVLSYSSLSENTSYRLVVSGIVDGLRVGAYALSYQVAAVPLPAAGLAFATAIAGLAAISRRRRRVASAV